MISPMIDNSQTSNDPPKMSQSIENDSSSRQQVKHGDPRLKQRRDSPISTASLSSRANIYRVNSCVSNSTGGSADPVIPPTHDISQESFGQKPRDILRRLYAIWPTQLTSSYRVPVVASPEATAEFNLNCLKELREGERLCPVVNKASGKNKSKETGSTTKRKPSSKFW